MRQYLADQDASKAAARPRRQAAVPPPPAQGPVAAPEPAVLAEGLIHGTTTLRIYRDGTFSTKGGIFGGWSQRDRLLAFDFDMDSMRRKSMTGRGAAAMMTGGLSLVAANNRGVLYVTVTGETTGVRTYTTRNPMGIVLSGTRSLKQAADSLTAPPAPSATGSVGDSSVASQLEKLAELYAAGALTAAEFAAAKARLLS